MSYILILIFVAVWPREKRILNGSLDFLNVIAKGAAQRRILRYLGRLHKEVALGHNLFLSDLL